MWEIRIPHADHLALLDDVRRATAGGAGGDGAAEPAAPVTPDDPLPRSTPRPAFVDERLVQAIWRERLLAPDGLIAADGRRVVVHDPGRWQTSGAGPDFRNADLEIGGRRLRGDVEIHVDSADWDRHRHSYDFEYNRVILHAFLRRTDDGATERLQSGETAPRLELGTALQPDLDTIQRSLSAEDLAPPPASEDSGDAPEPSPTAGTESPEGTTAPACCGCRSRVSAVPADLMRRYLLSCARERMEDKAARYAAQTRLDPPDQVLYQAVMAGMGQRGGKTLYFLLAKRTPIAELARYLRDTSAPEIAGALESLLLHTANLATTAARTDAEAPDDATRAYLARATSHWDGLSTYFDDRIIPPTRRWFDGVRPQSFPGRRLAGVARWLADSDFRRGLLDSLLRRLAEARDRQPRTATEFRREIAALATLFEAATAGPDPEDAYWSRRYTLGGKPAARPMRLIGEDRSLSILYNALLPNALAAARTRGDRALEEFVWRLHENFPALPANAITRHMAARLFGPAGPPPAVADLRWEKSAQALLHVFHRCCDDATRTGADCLFAGRALAPDAP